MLETATPESCDMDAKIIANGLEQFSAQQQGIHGVLVVRNGRIVVDARAPRQSSSKRHIINSCTKTVLSALAGIAIDRGLIAEDDAVLAYFPEQAGKNRDKRWDALRIRHLLSMSSGISWPQYGPNNISDAMGHSADWIQFILGRPIEAEPGSVVNYSNGDSHLVSAILQRVIGKTALEFGREVLFGPLGITDMVWESDPQGRSIGSAALYLRPADMAKIGLLYLDGGQWDGQQVVSREWIAASWRKYGEMPTAGGPAGYGYYWWLYPDMGLCEAWGGAGQRIAVLRNSQTVVVITADNPNDTPRMGSISALYTHIEKSVVAAVPLPEDPTAMKRLRAAQRLYAAARKKEQSGV